jgi:hypothetical protein
MAILRTIFSSQSLLFQITRISLAAITFYFTSNSKCILRVEFVEKSMQSVSRQKDASVSEVRRENLIFDTGSLNGEMNVSLLIAVLIN